MEMFSGFSIVYKGVSLPKKMYLCICQKKMGGTLLMAILLI